MDNQRISQNISQIKELLQGADSIGILVTEFQSLDKVGAGLALYLALQEAGKNVQIVSKKDPLVEISNLVGIDKISKSFDGVTKKLVVSLPYYEGEVEKVSYNIEGNKLNINLFATKDKSISFSEKDVDYIRSGSNPSVIVTIGIRKQEEMAGIISADSQAKIIRLDTVLPQQEFGEVTLAGSEFSSISEIVSLLIRDMKLPIDGDIAQNLMDGLVVATSNFSAVTTSSAAFASAAYLLANNAQRKPMSPTTNKSQDIKRGPRNESVARPQNNLDQLVNQNVPQKQESTVAVNPVGSGDQNTASLPESPISNESISSEPSQSEVPSDWFVPKVFKSSKTQE
jgi:nanoRNase/pAp phosphatase (c-di-AMP/oligoRNAs hydrolase)